MDLLEKIKLHNERLFHAIRIKSIFDQELLGSLEGQLSDLDECEFLYILEETKPTVEGLENTIDRYLTDLKEYAENELEFYYFLLEETKDVKKARTVLEDAWCLDNQIHINILEMTEEEQEKKGYDVKDLKEMAEKKLIDDGYMIYFATDGYSFAYELRGD